MPAHHVPGAVEAVRAVDERHPCGELLQVLRHGGTPVVHRPQLQAGRGDTRQCCRRPCRCLPAAASAQGQPITNHHAALSAALMSPPGTSQTPGLSPPPAAAPGPAHGTESVRSGGQVNMDGMSLTWRLLQHERCQHATLHCRTCFSYWQHMYALLAPLGLAPDACCEDSKHQGCPTQPGRLTLTYLTPRSSQFLGS